MRGISLATRGFHEGGGLCLATSGRICDWTPREAVLFACRLVTGYMQRQIRIKGYKQRCP